MPGHINWVEGPAADTAKARTFYGGLFGWGTSEFGGDYHVIDKARWARSRPARTISPTRGSTSPRATSTASTKRVHELGGRSEDVQTIPGVGRIAHCRDDQGTPFSLHEPAPQG